MGKNAIVFGATSGIGRELAKLLVDDGYKVMITGRRIERLEEIKKENPESYIAQQHDITDLNASDELFKKLPSIFDKVDLIVHNSGIATPNYKLEWDKDAPTIYTNVVGATKVYQLAYNYFAVQGHGHLVGVTSVASLRGNRQVPAYHASKAYQASYLESLYMKSLRTKKAKINVTEIIPGFVDTDIIMGKTFWMSSVDKASKQIYIAIKRKKRKAYITKRWRLVSFVLRCVSPKLYMKLM
jgi:short-subunit dehydrogenase